MRSEARRPEDFGFVKTRGGHRLESWEGHGCRLHKELVDEDTGERVVVLSHPEGKEYRDAWTDGEARRELAGLADAAEREYGDPGVDPGTVDPEFDFGGGL